MLRNYLHSAFRQIKKHGLFFLINVSGFSIGIATVVIIFLYINYELSFDKGMNHYNNLYRVCWETTLGGVNEIRPASPPPLCATYIEEFPEVLSGVRLSNDLEAIVKLGDQSFCEPNFYYADSTFFEIFSVPLITGDESNVLAKPNTVVLTKSIALKLFGNLNVVGKSLKLENETNFEIVGICEDIPATYHLDIDYIASINTLPISKWTSWPTNPFQTYILLDNVSSLDGLVSKIPALTKLHMEPAIRGIMNISFDEFIEGGSNYAYHLQAVRDIHLRSNMMDDPAKRSSIKYVYIFMIVALLVLSLAIINYVNLSSAKGIERVKEIGIRKIIGAERKDIIKQFLGESVFITLISTIIGMMIVETALPYINSILSLDLSVGYFDNIFVLPSLIGFVLVLSVLSGMYPAFIISSFNALSVFRHKVHISNKSFGFKSLLIVFQYSISFILIIATLVVFEQLNYMRDKELGYDDEQVLIIKNAHLINSSVDAFKEELIKEPGIEKVSMSRHIPGTEVHSGFVYRNGDSEDEVVPPMVMGVDHDFISCYNMVLTQGRDFDKNIRLDSTALIINEAAAKAYGLKDPLNESYISSGGDPSNTMPIIGVVKDFNYESLHETIKPCFLYIDGGSKFASIKLKAKNATESLKRISRIWSGFTCNPFEYYFIDQDFDSLYKQEVLMRRLFTVFSFISLFIASVGLFGIVLFMTEKRTKEIGIRKAIGASRRIIFRLFIYEYIKWIGVSVIVGAPVVWWAASKWLQQFAYRINFHFGFLIVAFILLLLVTFLTIYSRVMYVARQNPVKALRYE